MMEEMLGKKNADLQGRPFFEAMPEVRIQGLEHILEGVMNTKTSYISQEQKFLLTREPGLETRYVTYIYEPLIDNHENITGIIVVAKDVTLQVLARLQIE